MNLYLVLALALGMTAPSAVSPRVHAVIAESEVRAAVRMEHRLQPVRTSRLKPGLHRRSPRAARLVKCGAASPRAPAL